MKVYEFVHEMTTTSSIFGRKADVQVTFEGDGAWTDGKRINLPAMNMDADLTLEQVMAMRGYVDHEAGHNRSSDMDRIIDFYGRCISNGKEDLKDLHNCIEDVWMERETFCLYPGSRKNLYQVGEVVKKEEYAFFQTEEGKQFTEGFSNQYIGTMLKANNPAYRREGNWHDKALESLTEEQRAWIDRWTDDVQNCTSTEDCITLAKSIYKQTEEWNQQQEQSGEESEPDLGDPNEFDPSSGSDMEEGDNTVSENEARKAAGLGEEASGGTEGSSLIESGDGKTGGLGVPDGPLTGGYRVYSTREDFVYKRGQKKGDSNLVSIVNATDATRYNEIKTQLSGVIRTMKSKLKRSLLAKQQRDWDSGRLEGALDSRRIVAGNLGAENIFKKRIDREDEDTAISILVDLSGSMWSNNKDVVANECVVALSECLEGTGFSFRIAGFTNKREAPFNYLDSPTFHHRYEPLDTVVFKDYNESLRKAKASIGHLVEAVGGNNSDYDFIANEVTELRKRPESRKVLFVLSDGHPAHMSDASSDELIRHARNAVKYGQKNGVECIGIGITSTAVEEIYDDYVVVSNVNDLSGIVFNKLTKLLTK